MFTRTLLPPVLAPFTMLWVITGCRPADIAGPEMQAHPPSLSFLTSQDAAHPVRPFRASLQGEVAFLAREEGRCRTMDLPFITASAGTGGATHMGQVRFDGDHCFEAAAGPPPPHGLFERGQMTLVAANGDELHTVYDGEQTTAVFSNPTLGTAEYVFSGGTGRFADASGWAHAEIYVEVPADGADPWPIRLVLEGQITY